MKINPIQQIPSISNKIEYSVIKTCEIIKKYTPKQEKMNDVNAQIVDLKVT